MSSQPKRLSSALTPAYLTASGLIIHAVFRPACSRYDACHRYLHCIACCNCLWNQIVLIWLLAAERGGNGGVWGRLGDDQRQSAFWTHWREPCPTQVTYICVFVYLYTMYIYKYQTCLLSTLRRAMPNAGDIYICIFLYIQTDKYQTCNMSTLKRGVPNAGGKFLGR